MGIERTNLGFSLKPPAWLRTAVKDIVGGKPTTVPLPSGASVQVTPLPAQPVQTAAADVNNAVQSNVPGGWLTIAAIGAAAFFLLRKGRR